MGCVIHIVFAIGSGRVGAATRAVWGAFSKFGFALLLLGSFGRYVDIMAVFSACGNMLLYCSTGGGCVSIDGLWLGHSVGPCFT